MPERPDRLDPVDLLQIRLDSAVEALTAERLRHLDTQQQNAHLMQALVEERRTRLLNRYTEAEQRLRSGEALLERKYGVTERTQVDWETGAIQRPAEQTEATRPATPQQEEAAHPAPPEGAGGVPATDHRAAREFGAICAKAAAATRTQPPWAGGAEGAGPVVDGVPQE